MSRSGDLAIPCPRRDGTSDTLLVDAHVHFHGCYRLDDFLDGAVLNFDRAASELGLRHDPVGCLLLAERRTEYAFRRFRTLGAQRGDSRWRFRPTSEDASLIACRDATAKLVVVAGRQIATQEGLEVLALACAAEFPDGRPIRWVLDAVLASDAIPVLPWGFGKWWFRRGRLVEELLESEFAREVFLGDNAGRLRTSRRPPQFALAEAKGVPILPGTDPLPLPRQERRAGAYGFVLDGPPDLDRPGHHLGARLRDHAGQPRVYGRLESLANFIRNQAAANLRKHFGSR